MPNLSDWGNCYATRMMLVNHDGLPFAVWPLEHLNDNNKLHAITNDNA
jgi:hypothetical protein